MEIDLLLHLGEFFNANLLERGVYRIRISMACGTQRVVPVGMFTAPSTLDSFVGDQSVSSSLLPFFLLILNTLTLLCILN